MSVTLIASMGSDEVVARAAWVSTQRDEREATPEAVRTQVGKPGEYRVGPLDEALALAAHVAALAAREAQATGDWHYVQRFDRISRLIAEAQRHDAHEVGLVAKAIAVFTRLCQIVRGINLRLTGELAKRGAGRGRR